MRKGWEREREREKELKKLLNLSTCVYVRLESCAGKSDESNIIKKGPLSVRRRTEGGGCFFSLRPKEKQ